MLTAAEKKQLRARGHALKSVVLVGSNGLSAAVLEEINRALVDHELIKVKIHHADRALRAELASEICEQLEAEFVQAIGKVILLFRPNPD